MKIIKKYKNRKLYEVGSGYITIQTAATYILNNEAVVFDFKGNDITNHTLLLAIHFKELEEKNNREELIKRYKSLT